MMLVLSSCGDSISPSDPGSTTDPIRGSDCPPLAGGASGSQGDLRCWNGNAMKCDDGSWHSSPNDDSFCR